MSGNFPIYCNLNLIIFDNHFQFINYLERVIREKILKTIFTLRHEREEKEVRKREPKIEWQNNGAIKIPFWDYKATDMNSNDGE